MAGVVKDRIRATKNLPWIIDHGIRAASNFADGLNRVSDFVIFTRTLKKVVELIIKIFDDCIVGSKAVLSSETLCEFSRSQSTSGTTSKTDGIAPALNGALCRNPPLLIDQRCGRAKCKGCRSLAACSASCESSNVRREHRLRCASCQLIFITARARDARHRLASLIIFNKVACAVLDERTSVTAILYA